MRNINGAHVLTILATLLLCACKDDRSVSSPACAELQKETDPAKKAELLKKCPRGAGEFKPSPVRNW